MKTWKYHSTTKCSLQGLNPLLSRLLQARNIDTDEKIHEFLNPEMVPFIPFSVFNDAEKVLDRIFSAIKSGEKIVVYGDFDTDGVTSTAILYKTLVKLGANTDYYLPDRDSESHGLNNKALINLISKQKAKLIITVDCGISNSKEIQLAQTFKTDVIITDHHEAPEELPKAYGIINPKAKNVLQEKTSAKEIESLCYLSGAGIALKLASALLERATEQKFFDKLLPIAALGTIGDIVPLLLENRRIAKCGIEAIRNKVNKGITILFENAGVKDFSKITSETIAFTAVPRINATGRLGSAETAFKLLISDDEEEINKISKELNETNSLRQDLCAEAFDRAKQIVEEQPELYKNSIVICDEEAHIGIIGLSASKLVETYNLPAFVMRKDGNTYRCSCRAPKGVNIYDVLNENKDLFLGYGGHEFAGGFSFDGAVNSFEKVRKAINDTVVEQTNGEKLENILDIDLLLEPQDVNEELVETIKVLEPFGAANPSPTFAMTGLKVFDYRFMGQNQNHLKVLCSSNDGRLFECIKWSTPDFSKPRGKEINIAFAPEINEFNGKTTVQLLIKDMQFPNEKAEFETKLIDCRSQKGGYDKIVDFLAHTKKSVKIFTEIKDIVEYFSKNELSKDKIFGAEDAVKNVDLAILVDCPPSVEFLKNLVNSGTKEILLMNYDELQIETPKFLSKIAGMMRYTVTSLGGKTNLKTIRPVLCTDNEIIREGFDVLKNAKVLDGEISENGKISVKSVHAAGMSEITKSESFKTFDDKFGKYKKFVQKINNSPQEELKEMIFK